LKWLQYTRAGEVENISLLLLHQLQAGHSMMPLTTPLHDVQEWFKSGKARGPIQVEADLPAPGSVHEDLESNPIKAGDVARAVSSLGKVNVHASNAAVGGLLVGYDGVEVIESDIPDDVWLEVGEGGMGSGGGSSDLNDLNESELLKLLAAVRKKEAEKRRAERESLPDSERLLARQLEEREIEIIRLKEELVEANRIRNEGPAPHKTKRVKVASSLDDVMRDLDEEENGLEGEMEGLGQEEENVPLGVKALKKELMSSVMAGGSMSLKTVSKLPGEMKLEREEHLIRRNGQREKFNSPSDQYEHLHNQKTDEHTSILIRLARAEVLRSLTMNFNGVVSSAEESQLTAKESVLQFDCEVVQKSLNIIGIMLEQLQLGRSSIAAEMLDIWRKEDQGIKPDPDGERILKKAKAEVKESEGFMVLKGLEDMQRNFGMMVQQVNAGGAAGSQGSNHQRQLQQAPKRGRAGQLAISGGGMSHNQSRFEVRWVDGEAEYGAVLKGVEVPLPGTFPKFEQFFMDAPVTAGVVHQPGTGCKIPCGGCRKIGHIFSECPARRWQEAGKDRVNWRWLFEQGYVNGKGIKA
jgi:hypothetical protein